MANIIKRVMYGTEVAGYITDNRDEQYRYLDKGLALHFAGVGLLENAKVGNQNGKMIIQGKGNNNLNDLERVNINIDKIDPEIYNHIGNKLVFKLLVNIADGINNDTKIEGRIYKLLLDFVDKAKLCKYSTFKGIYVTIYRDNIMTGDRVTFRLNWGTKDILQIECNTLNNEMFIKAAVYGSNTVPYTVTRALVGTSACIDKLASTLNEILKLEGVSYKDKQLTFREKSQRERNNTNRIVAAFINLANNEQIVNTIDTIGNYISELEIKQNKVFDTTYSYSIRLGTVGTIKLACKVLHKNNVSNEQHEYIALRAVIEKDGNIIPINLGRLCNKTLLYELTTPEITSLLEEINTNLSVELHKYLI